MTLFSVYRKTWRGTSLLSRTLQRFEARAGAKSPSAITLYLHSFRLGYHSGPQSLSSRRPSCAKEKSSGVENVSVFSPTELKLV